MAIRILSVTGHSMAERVGIQPGETLLKINGEDILDEIDYQALTAGHKLKIALQAVDGTERELTVLKKPWVPLGLTLDERAVLSPRECKNHCIFCFVDQLPKGLRKSLYVRDDDWRLSLMMGNFVTLTNVDDREFERIIRRKASPLYISVHATDPAVRVKMLRNPQAGNLLERLRIMKENGLRFHCQVVLCPGINDGPVLHQTIVDLAALYPSALSLAVVPVGLTTHRGKLPELKMFDRDSARSLLTDLELIQAYYLKTMGTRFVYPSDEFYSIAARPVPDEEFYEGYPQIENGVGMLTLMAAECEEAFPSIRERSRAAGLPGKRRILIPTGVSALSFIRGLVEKYAPPEEKIQVIPVPNHFFGETVTVTGLIVGRDLISSLEGLRADLILISESMLRENTDCFLDDTTVTEIQTRLGIPIRVVDNHGDSFLKALYGLEE